MKKRTKIIIALITLVALLSSGVGGYFLFFHQPEPMVTDRTGEKVAVDPAVQELTEQTNVAVFAPGVTMFTEDTADTINQAIVDTTFQRDGIILQLEGQTPLADLGVGDIFYLEGDSSTPLGETYIGKIAAAASDGTNSLYMIETPSIDEVFDVLNINFDQTLDAEHISRIETMEGVTLSNGSAVTPLGSDQHTGGVVPLGHTATPLGDTADTDKGQLVFEVELDLLKALGLADDEEFDERYSEQEGYRVNVFINKIGKCYHREKCSYVKQTSTQTTLAEAKSKELSPCSVCKPPVYEEDSIEKLTFGGKIGFESLDFDIVFDWDILGGNGIENLILTANGNFVVDCRLTAQFEKEFGGDTTQISLLNGDIKIEGLKEKVFPLAYVGYNFGSVVTAHSADGVRMVTSAVPLTVGAMVYMDINGKVAVTSTVFFNYTQPFSYTREVIRDGEVINETSQADLDPDVTFGLESEITAEFDANMGACVLVHVFNLNPVELNVVKLGVEGEGAAKICYTNKATTWEEGASASYYVRVYFKFMELRLNLKVNLDFWNAFSTDFHAKLEAALYEKTLAEWGKKNPTTYNSVTMKYNLVTASDPDAIYYKDTNGMLVRQVGDYRTVLDEEEFFAICGIDESYIYILRNSEGYSGTHDIYRVNKVDGTGKKIVDGVTNCLTTDAQYIYYISDFDDSSVMRIDRSTLDVTTFYNDEHLVRYMQPQGDGFYIVVEKYDPFAAFWGATYYYRMLDTSGKVTEDYGSNPSVPNLAMREEDTFYQTAKITSSGYLRNTASAAYWVSKDKTQWIKAESKSGWFTHSVGVFVTVEAPGDSEYPYSIKLYRAADGALVHITDVESDQAFFTLCQSKDGSWFFFDQTADSLILYQMSKDFSTKTAVKTFSLEDIPANLSTCGTTIMNNRIYFYTVENNQVCNVLYRYDIS